MPRLTRSLAVSVLSVGVVVSVVVSVAPLRLARAQSTPAVSAPGAQPGCAASLRRGRWLSGGGNIFWIQCIGNDVFWMGMNRKHGAVREGERWTQVGHGTVRGHLVDLVWSDVPYGVITTAGRIQLKLESDTLLRVVRDDGLFGEPRLRWVAAK